MNLHIDDILSAVSIGTTIYVGLHLVVVRSRASHARSRGLLLLIPLAVLVGASLPWITAQISGKSWPEPRIAQLAGGLDALLLGMGASFVVFVPPTDPERREGWKRMNSVLDRAAVRSPEAVLGSSIGAALGIFATAVAATAVANGLRDAEGVEAAGILIVVGLIGSMVFPTLGWIAGALLGAIAARVRR